MSLNFKQNKKGFTLIETLLYLALFGVIFFSIMQFFYSASELNLNADANNNIRKNNLFITNHFDTSVEDTISIDLANTDFDIDLGKIRLITNEGFIEYSTNSSQLFVNRNNQINSISDSNIYITRLRFSEVNFETELKGFKVEIDFQSNKNNRLTESISKIYIIE